MASKNTNSKNNDKKVTFNKITPPKKFPTKEDGDIFLDSLLHYIDQACECFSQECYPFSEDGTYMMKLKYPKNIKKADRFYLISKSKSGDIIKSDDIYYKTDDGFNITNFIRDKKIEFMKMLGEALPNMEIFLNLNRKFPDNKECCIVFYWKIPEVEEKEIDAAPAEDELQEIVEEN
jgi:hypothetical protein